MNDDGLGLLITPDHEQTINSFSQLPVAFGSADADTLPDEWSSPIATLNQGQSNSCAGHAGASNFNHRQFVEVGELVNFSPWFSYISSQKRSGIFLGRDGGTSIKSVIDSATLDGCCLEALCPRPSRYSTTLTQDATRDAAAHKHIGGIVDLRDWQSMIDWLTDRRSCVIGTRWHSTQASVRDVETKALGTGGKFLGYHARSLIGYKKLEGQICPIVLNSHGKQWGNNGRAVVTPDLWQWWKKDSAFFCLGFSDIFEREPKRRDWSQVRSGDTC